MDNNASNEARVTEVSTGTSDKKSKFKMPSKKLLVLIPLIIILGAALYYFRGSFVVASVNGSFISRASFNKEMEAQAGQQVLDSLVITKLIEEKVSDIEVSGEEINAQIEKTKAQLPPGTTLESALEERGMTESEFKRRVTTQVKLEKLFGDKLAVTDEEVKQALKESAGSLPKGVDKETLKAQITESLRQQKFSSEIQQLVETLKAEAKIQYFIEL